MTRSKYVKHIVRLFYAYVIFDACKRIPTTTSQVTPRFLKSVA